MVAGPPLAALRRGARDIDRPGGSPRDASRYSCLQLLGAPTNVQRAHPALPCPLGLADITAKRSKRQTVVRRGATRGLLDGRPPSCRRRQSMRFKARLQRAQCSLPERSPPRRGQRARPDRRELGQGTYRQARRRARPRRALFESNRDGQGEQSLRAQPPGDGSGTAEAVRLRRTANNGSERAAARAQVHPRGEAHPSTSPLRSSANRG